MTFSFTVKVLHFQRRSVEVHSFAVGEDVQPVPPLGGFGSQPDFDHCGRVVARHHGAQRGRPHRPVNVVRQLFEPALDVELELFRVHVNQHELAFAVESVLQVVERDHVRVAEHGS